MAIQAASDFFSGSGVEIGDLVPTYNNTNGDQIYLSMDGRTYYDEDYPELAAKVKDQSDTRVGQLLSPFGSGVGTMYAVDNGTIIACVKDEGPTFGDMARSTDFGSTWDLSLTNAFTGAGLVSSEYAVITATSSSYYNKPLAVSEAAYSGSDTIVLMVYRKDEDTSISGRHYSVIYSSDLGVTWTEGAITPDPTNINNYARYMECYGTTVVMIIDNQKMVYSSNRGATWSTSTTPALQASTSIYTLAIEGNIVLAATQNDTDKVLRSTNGGASFSTVASSTKEMTTRITLASNGEGVASYRSGTIEAYNYTTDFGATWAALAPSGNAGGCALDRVSGVVFQYQPIDTNSNLTTGWISSRATLSSPAVVTGNTSTDAINEGTVYAHNGNFFGVSNLTHSSYILLNEGTDTFTLAEILNGNADQALTSDNNIKYMKVRAK